MEDKCCNVNVNETITDLRYDSVTGDLVYRNEAYHLQGDGEKRINARSIANNINLEDLANVDDKVVKGCGILNVKTVVNVRIALRTRIVNIVGACGEHKNMKLLMELNT